MNYPTIDNATKEAVEALTSADIGNAYAFSECVVRYGVEAVCHAVFMQQALEFQNETDVTAFLTNHDVVVRGKAYGNASMDQISDPRAKSYATNRGRIVFPKKAMGSDGVYVPTETVQRRDNHIILFNGDYINLCMNPETGEFDAYPDGREIMDYFATNPGIDVFLDKDMIERGLRFSQYLFDKCVKDFEKYKEERVGIKPPQSEYMTDLGRKLLSYYRTIVYNR